MTDSETNLRRMRYLINRLPMAQFRVERAMSQATRMTSVITGMPGGGGDGQTMLRSMDALEAAKEARNAIAAELNELRLWLAELIPLLQDPLERQCMHMRYMQGYSGREIAYRMAYSENHIFRVLRQAEEKVAIVERC